MGFELMIYWMVGGRPTTGAPGLVLHNRYQTLASVYCLICVKYLFNGVGNFAEGEVKQNSSRR